MPDQPNIEHREWCTDPSIRESNVPFERGAVRYRCLGCGVNITIPKPVTR